MNLNKLRILLSSPIPNIDSQARTERSLDTLQCGECGHVVRCTDQRLALRLLELGIDIGSPIRLCWHAPLGDTLCIEALSYRLSLRRMEARQVVLAV